MDILPRIINCLKSKEIQSIKSFLKEGNENKKLQLFNLMLEGHGVLDKTVVSGLSKGKHNSTLCQLKKRLKQDILNILIKSSFSDIKEESLRVELECHKRLLLGKILIYRGLTAEGLEVLEKAAELAEKFELHTIKLSCDDVLRTFRSRRMFGTQGQVYSDQINHSVESIRNILQAKAINYPFISSRTFSYASFSEEIPLKKLQEKSDQSKSRKAVHWYAMAIIHYYIQEGDVENAEIASYKLISRLKAERASVFNYEGREFYLQLSRIFLFLHQPKEALWGAEAALQCHSEQVSDMLPLLEVLFLANFRCKNFSKAEEMITIAEKIIEKDPELPNNIFLLRASLQFSQKKYRQVINSLACNDHAVSDGFILKLNSRFLELITILEMGDYEWFEYKYEAFRKRLQKIKSKNIRRMQQLFHLLTSVRKHRYEFNQFVSEECIKFINKQEEDKELCWDPLGFEVINFSNWFYSKVVKFKNENLGRKEDEYDLMILRA